MADLKPCPFCGGKAEMWQPGTRHQSCIVECGNCGCRLESGDEGGRSGASWNRRAAPIVPQGWTEDQIADTCTAALSARVAELERQAAQLTAERDEWAHKAQDWRHKYAELRYPGMTREVKALDAAIDAAMKETTK